MSPNFTDLKKEGEFHSSRQTPCFATSASITASVEAILDSAGAGSLQVSNGSK